MAEQQLECLCLHQKEASKSLIFENGDVMYLAAIIYFCHKIKHIPFDNTTYVLETLRTETFERYPKMILADNKSRIYLI